MAKCALINEEDDKSPVILDSQSMTKREIKKNIRIIEYVKEQGLLEIVEDEKNIWKSGNDKEYNI